MIITSTLARTQLRNQEKRAGRRLPLGLRRRSLRGPERAPAHLGQQVLELLPGEREQEGADDSLQLALRHRQAPASVQQLEGFPQLILSVVDFLK